MSDEQIQQEIDKIVKGEQAKIMAEDAYGQASMVLLACIESRTAIEATIMKQAYDRGPEYLTAMLVSAVMMSRALAWGYTGNPDAKFSDSLRPNPKGGEVHTHAYGFLHRLMDSASQEESLAVAKELQEHLRGAEPEQGARVALCLLHASGQLVSITLQQANVLCMEHLRGDHEH